MASTYNRCHDPRTRERWDPSLLTGSEDPHAPMTGDPRQVRVGHALVWHPERPWGGQRGNLQAPRRGGSDGPNQCTGIPRVHCSGLTANNP